MIKYILSKLIYILIYSIDVDLIIFQNKQRFVEGEHNLDLTYVTKHVIATSFPSEGMMAYYRNKISDVAKFLDERHGVEKFGEHRYWVYNLCSEMSYDEEKFHNRVKTIPIPDHNVPTVKQMIDFVSEV